MQITVQFKDNTSFNKKDAETTYSNMFDGLTVVTTAPNNDSPEEHIYYALQALITEDQINAYYDQEFQYDVEEAKIIKNVSKIISNVLKKVLEDNLKKCR